nr:unnamed protein product [Callosobruchus chinensis]
MQAKEKWLSRLRFPAAVAVVDCTYICIGKTLQFGDDYVKSKGFSSINVEITCDQHCVITSIYAS